MKRGFKTVKPLGGPRDRRHGTIGAYAYWGCRCEKCLDANLVANREMRANRMANLRPGDHGKAATYAYGCRCEPCREANRHRPRRAKRLDLPEVDFSALA